MEPLFTDKVVRCKWLNWLILQTNFVLVILYRNVMCLSLRSRETLDAERVFKELVKTTSVERDDFFKWQSSAPRLTNKSNQIETNEVSRTEIDDKNKNETESTETLSSQDSISTYSGSLSVDSHLFEEPKKEEKRERDNSIFESKVDKTKHCPTYNTLAGQLGFKKGYVLDNSLIRRLKLYKNVDQESCLLRIPDRNKWFSAASIVFELAIVARYLAVLFLIRPFNQNQVMVTSTRNSWGYDKYYSSSDDSSNLNLHLPERKLQNFYGEECEISTKLVDLYVDHRYRNFRVWNMSKEFSPEIVRRVIFVEQQPSVQIFSFEARMIVYLSALFISSMLLANINVRKMPIDVSAMAFLFEPRFCAFKTHARLIYYLNSMRTSYLNFWSTYSIDLTGSLTFRPMSSRLKRLSTRNNLSNDQGEGKNAERINRNRKLHWDAIEDSVEVVDSVALSQAQYDKYMPRARSQAWRQIMLIVHPAIQLVLIIFICLCLIGIFIFYVNLNAVSIHLNREIKSIVRNDSESELIMPPGLPIADRCQDEESKLKIASQFKEKLKDRLTRAIRNRRDSPSQPLVSGQLIEEQAEEEKFDLANMIQPVHVPLLSDWSIVAASCFVIAILISLVVSLHIVCIADICLWLLELRVKLHICVQITKHYQSLKQDRRLLQFEPPPTVNSLSIDDQISSGGSSGFLSGLSLLRAPLDGAASDHPATGSLSGPSTPPPGVDFDTYMPSTEPLDWKATNVPLDRKSNGNHQDHESKLRSLTLSDGEYCNLDLKFILNYLFANRSARNKLVDDYTQKFIQLDLIESIAHRRTTDKFLTSTYLDFRIFQDEIDDCRRLIYLLSVLSVLNSLNLIAGSVTVDDQRIQAGLIATAFILGNMLLVGGSVFHSQCSKLHNPIYSMLAASIDGAKTVRHLALLWRRSLVDLSGSRSKFAFRIYSFKISYATTLQVSLFTKISLKSTIENCHKN